MENHLFYEGESVVYDGFKYVWPVKGQVLVSILRILFTLTECTFGVRPSMHVWENVAKPQC